MAYTANPIQLQERNKLIDCLRGFALLGVLIANLGGFISFALPEENIKQLTSLPGDKIAGIFLALFIDNKFITLFSLLFGYGFGVIIERLTARSIPVNSFFMKRMAVLLLTGLLHLCFWWGEILSTYALCGMLLLFFRKLGDRGLLLWGAVLLFLVTPLIQGLQWYLLPDQTAYRDLLFKNYLNTIQSGSFFAIVEYNFKVLDFLYIERWSQFRDMAEILGKFLFGFYILRRNLLSENKLNILFLKKVQLYTMIIAAVYLLQRSLFTDLNSKPLQLVQFVFERGGILALSLLYAVTIALLFQKGKYRAVLNAFQQTGMMSLTNYLAHTVFFILIYYSMGFGLMGRLHLQWTIPIALAIYVLQVFFSKWWMKRMRYGPVEWLWRQATYAKRLPLKK